MNFHRNNNQNKNTHSKYYNKKKKNTNKSTNIEENDILVKKIKTKKVLSSMDEINELNKVIANIPDDDNEELFKTIDLGSTLLVNIGKAVSESVTNETNDLINDIEFDIMNKINNDKELNDVKVNLSNTLIWDIKDAVSNSMKEEEDNLLLEIEDSIMNKLNENKKLKDIEVNLSDTMVANMSNLISEDQRDNELLEKINEATKNRLEELKNIKENNNIFENDIIVTDNLNNLFVNLEDENNKQNELLEQISNETSKMLDNINNTDNDTNFTNVEIENINNNNIEEELDKYIDENEPVEFNEIKVENIINEDLNTNDVQKVIDDTNTEFSEVNIEVYENNDKVDNTELEINEPEINTENIDIEPNEVELENIDVQEVTNETEVEIDNSNVQEEIKEVAENIESNVNVDKTTNDEIVEKTETNTEVQEEVTNEPEVEIEETVQKENIELNDADKVLDNIEIEEHSDIDLLRDFNNPEYFEDESSKLPVTEEDIDAFVDELMKTKKEEKIEVFDDANSFIEDLNDVLEFKDEDFTYDLGKSLILNLNSTVNDSIKTTTRRILDQVEKKTEEIVNNIKFDLKDEEEIKQEELERTLELAKEESLKEEKLRLKRLNDEDKTKIIIAPVGLEIMNNDVKTETNNNVVSDNAESYKKTLSRQEEIKNMESDPNYVPFEKLRDTKLDERIASHIKKVKDSDLVRAFHLSYEKRLIFLGVMLAVFCIMSVVFLKNSFVETSEDSINYSESSSVNYEVYLKENDFYTQSYLTKADYNNSVRFIASLIDHIKVNFQYVFNIDDEVDVDFTYDINAKLVIEDGSGGTYNEKVYKLVENKEVKLTGGKTKAFIDSVEINYDEYNEYANNFRSEFGVNTDSYLLVYMTIHKKNDDGKFKFLDGDDTQVMNMNIPLSQKSIDIKLNLKEFNQKSNILRVAEKTIGNTACFILFILSGLFAIAIFVLIIIYGSYSLNRESKYDKEVNRILKDYDTSIVNTDVLPDFNNKVKIKLNKFIELLDLHDNLKLPIIYCNVVSHQKCYFYIEFDNKIYIYTVKDLEFKK